jgi:hypothetical protein
MSDRVGETGTGEDGAGGQTQIIFQ